MVPLDPSIPEWGDSRYLDVRLTGEIRLADALNHLYVLLPVLDGSKHYWTTDEEEEKLERAGAGRLDEHPERAFIARRYIGRRPAPDPGAPPLAAQRRDARRTPQRALIRCPGVAVSGACLVAGVVSAALDGADLGDAIEYGLLVSAEGRVRGEQTVAASVPARARLAIRLAQRAEDDHDFLAELYDVVGTWVTTTESVPAALGILVRADADPDRVTELAANAGGDTDTIGAMAGAMAGALSGLDAVPSDRLTVIREVNQIDPASLASELVAFRR